MESGLNELMTQIASESAPTQPGCFYSKDADCVFCHLEDVPYYAERVDGLLAIYRADDDARLVGAELKGASRFLQHDVPGSGLTRTSEVQVLDLVLRTYRSQPQLAARNPAVLKRKAGYFDLVDRVTSSATELQIAQ